MQHPGFFDRAGPFALDRIAAAVGAEVAAGGDVERLVHDVKPLSEAGPNDVTFLDNRKYLAQLEGTRAGACLVQPALAARVPSGTVALATRAPYRGFALALALFYPQAMHSRAARPEAATLIDPTAQIADGAEIEPGAVIGAEAAIGRGSRIAAGAVIGHRVHIGRGCYIGPNATVIHALLGDRVIIHP